MLRPMFGMGGTEILVILVVAMIFLGPEKLPEAAAKISKGIRDIRKQQRELTQTIENDTEIGGALRELKSALRGDEVRRPPVRKPPPAAETAAETPPAADAPAAPADAAPEAPSEPAPEALAAPAAERLPDPLAASEPAADDPDDPMKLIRPATGTAKREHG
jgi:sec-independent protein translocase protein TatB